MLRVFVGSATISGFDNSKINNVMLVNSLSLLSGRSQQHIQQPYSSGVLSNSNYSQFADFAQPEFKNEEPCFKGGERSKSLRKITFLKERQGVFFPEYKTLFNMHALSVAPGMIYSSARLPDDFPPRWYAAMLSQKGISTVFCLNPDIQKESMINYRIKKSLNEESIKYYNEPDFHIQDASISRDMPKIYNNTPQENLLMLGYRYSRRSEVLSPDKLHEIVMGLEYHTAKGENVMIFCGSGDGRSGTVKSALVLYLKHIKEGKTNVSDKYVSFNNNDFFKPTQNWCLATGLVADAITKVRETHPDNSHVAVERAHDIQILNEYYLYLQKYVNTDNV